MILNKTIENPNDILDFITSFDLAVKRQSKFENLNEKLIPKLYIGENKSFKENIENDVYDRPIMTFNLKQRGPASLSNSEFFIPPHQHGFLDNKVNGKGSDVYVQRKDNQIKITLRTKTQTEQMFLIGFLERVCDLQKHVFTSTKTQHVVTEVEEITQKDYYIFHFYMNCRTTIFATERNDIYFDSAVISNVSPICKFFNCTTQVCMNVDVSEEKKQTANDIRCSEKNFCDKHINKINIKIQA